MLIKQKRRKNTFRFTQAQKIVTFKFKILKYHQLFYSTVHGISFLFHQMASRSVQRNKRRGMVRSQRHLVSSSRTENKEKRQFPKLRSQFSILKTVSAKSDLSLILINRKLTSAEYVPQITNNQYMTVTFALKRQSKEMCPPSSLIPKKT